MKYKTRLPIWFWGALALLGTFPLFAAMPNRPITAPSVETSSSQETEVRAAERMVTGRWGERKFGVYFGGLGDPGPSLTSLNVAFHPTDFLRVHAGAGWLPLFIETATSYGGGVLVRPLTDTAVSPVIGVGVSAVRLRWENLGGILDRIFKNQVKTELGTDTFYVGNVKAGLDWQADTGFNLGVGVQLLVAELTLPLPYLHVGWFF